VSPPFIHRRPSKPDTRTRQLPYRTDYFRACLLPKPNLIPSIRLTSYASLLLQIITASSSPDHNHPLSLLHCYGPSSRGLLVTLQQPHHPYRRVIDLPILDNYSTQYNLFDSPAVSAKEEIFTIDISNFRLRMLGFCPSSHRSVKFQGLSR